MATIGLCMIVKNEAHVITRCLDSIRPLVDYLLIEDTGSSDGTQQTIRDWLMEKDLPGVVLEEPWHDFAYNRSHALSNLRKIDTVDYAMLIDADDVIVIDPGISISDMKRALTADFYRIGIRHGPMFHHRPQICSNKLPFRFRGAVHEFLECPDHTCTSGDLEGIAITIIGGGARSGDLRKFEKDAELIERALLTENEPFLVSRYTFYLAQSYRESGQFEKALTTYLKRAKLGYWSEEIFESLNHAGMLMESLAYSDIEIIGAYLKAYEYAPSRIESLHAAVRYCHRNGKPSLGYLLGKQAINKPKPAGGLFVFDWVYDYGMLDEFSIAAYWAGEYQDCLDACSRLLANAKLPLAHISRIQQNAQFARDHLPHPDRAIDCPSTRKILLDKEISFNICHVSINAHDRIFDDIIRMVQQSLVDLGYACSVRKNGVKAGVINILIGATVFAARSGSLDYLSGLPYIVYQFEQLDPNLGLLKDIPDYFEVLKSASLILEYSPSGMDYLIQAGLGDKSIYLPPSFHRTLELFRPTQEPDIDVLFHGSYTERRTMILTSLRSHGLKVFHAFGIYGEELIDYLRRSKIVINIHAWAGLNRLETVRMSFLLANRCFVVSETGDHNPYGTGVVYADYNALVSTCLGYLGPRADERVSIAADGYIEYRRSDFVADMQGALGQMPISDLLKDNRAVAQNFEMDVPSRLRIEGATKTMSTLDSYFKNSEPDNCHTGIPYIDFLKLISSDMKPRSYLEIGTESGTSLMQFKCDALCIDPAFQISQDVLLDRKKTFFFQTTSDKFFAENDLTAFFPRRIDVGFLDGLHHFEALLRDFINFERFSHDNTVALLHDCLPTDLVMTSRTPCWGKWTGDVWKILPILKKYRPDLKILMLDCPPTGLIACFGLDSRSNVLRDNYEQIVEEFSVEGKNELNIRELGSLFPLVDTRKLVESFGDVRLMFSWISWG